MRKAIVASILAIFLWGCGAAPPPVRIDIATPIPSPTARNEYQVAPGLNRFVDERYGVVCYMFAAELECEKYTDPDIFK